MKNILIPHEELKAIVKRLKATGKKIVFTNGCFDILHAGHVDYLAKAKVKGDILIIGLNSDESVARIKGKLRPIVNQNERAFILSNLRSVDYVTLFNEDTPLELISAIIPDVLVKGADWSIDNIVGKDIVLENGGSVEPIDFVIEQSTSKIVAKIKESYK
ncbi:MAG: D-glycero-beta-D-manno-heptose 1-phosphate adenylyltransferase [Bacteroidetes bacterium]|nr:D-glycero-beta-D-manno-heptose 1-phosphate adenylyltransferase [Bacteroidota bacterium]MBU1114116.1 D-glycero-beta-D-manno-heptose 1-phosphate adenylyltransferase [Bacteroidota bacterium]MBU1800189.1 D-glycero-beta-D-manno-heptose 1-phosphate adenylyltransferase [Bacteroidota bacterium]